MKRLFLFLLLFAPLSISAQNDFDCKDFDSKDFDAQCEKPPLSIYPNPTTDFLNLSEIVSDTEGVIFDTARRHVYISNLKNIDVSNLASGVYFLTLLPSKTNLKFVKL